MLFMKRTHNQSVLDAVSSADQSIILSTGPQPDALSNLTVIGCVPRDIYLENLAANETVSAFPLERSNESLTIHTPRNRVDLSYHQYDEFLELTAAIAQGEQVSPIVRLSSVGHWLPETFAADLSTARIIRGTDLSIVDRLETFRRYPQKLGAAIIDSCTREIDTKISAAVRHEPGTTIHTQLVSDVCLAGIRLLYAHEKVYFSGLEHSSPAYLDLSAKARPFAHQLDFPKNYLFAANASLFVDKESKNVNLSALVAE